MRPRIKNSEKLALKLQHMNEAHLWKLQQALIKEQRIQAKRNIFLQSISTLSIALTLLFAIYTYHQDYRKEVKYNFLEQEFDIAKKLVAASSRMTYSTTQSEEISASKEFWPLANQALLIGDENINHSVQEIAEYTMACIDHENHAPGVRWDTKTTKIEIKNPYYCSSSNLHAMTRGLARAARNWYIKASNLSLDQLDSGSIFGQWSIENDQRRLNR